MTRLPATEENLDIIAPDQDDLDYQAVRSRIETTNTDRRVKYAGLKTHQELAATYLAAGATPELAASKAGVSTRQIRKYQTDSDFRARVSELRETLTDRVRGAILNRFDELTAPGKIERLEVMDLARIYDRVAGTSTHNRNGGPVVNTGEGQERYDAFLQKIVVNVNSGKSTDFPTFEVSDIRLSEGDSPIDG